MINYSIQNNDKTGAEPLNIRLHLFEDGSSEYLEYYLIEDNPSFHSLFSKEKVNDFLGKKENLLAILPFFPELSKHTFEIPDEVLERVVLIFKLDTKFANKSALYKNPEILHYNLNLLKKYKKKGERIDPVFIKRASLLCNDFFKELEDGEKTAELSLEACKKKISNLNYLPKQLKSEVLHKIRKLKLTCLVSTQECLKCVEKYDLYKFSNINSRNLELDDFWKFKSNNHRNQEKIEFLQKVSLVDPISSSSFSNKEIDDLLKEMTQQIAVIHLSELFCYEEVPSLEVYYLRKSVGFGKEEFLKDYIEAIKYFYEELMFEVGLTEVFLSPSLNDILRNKVAKNKISAKEFLSKVMLYLTENKGYENLSYDRTTEGIEKEIFIELDYTENFKFLDLLNYNDIETLEKELGIEWFAKTYDSRIDDYENSI